MIPEHTVFPEFVADQVLTSDHLNNMFEYLDEQGRMTRSNLIGIGIVCGLQIKTVANTITITKGVAVTSEGYLIRQETDLVYTAFMQYDAVKEETYTKFVNTGVDPNTQKFDLWELTANTSELGSNLLTVIPGGLGQYIVLLFVELLHDQNKNCNPNSCDDKGINVAATIKPLLIFKDIANLNSLLGLTGNPLSFSPFYTLAELRMPRYSVPNNSSLMESEQILKVYANILNNDFLLKVETTLTAAHTMFSGFLGTIGSSPFGGLKAKFDFISNLSTKNQLLHLQYYYDIFSDLLLAYDEFRKLGNGILSTCCPDTSLFPRHVLLGEAVPLGTMISSFRHYFIYSPLFEKKNLISELRFLFSKMQLMKNHINIPPFVVLQNKGVRITPSSLGDLPLSQKAIPYYYQPLQVQPSWSFDKTIRGKAMQNLSYHAPEYNTVDAFVNSPLEYDLEPYNFLRVEGHIGKRYTEVLTQLNMMKEQFRLPVDVIALSTGDVDLSKIADGTISCNIRDLETSYEIIRREWEAVIGKMIEYLHDYETGTRSLLSEASVGSDIFGDYMVLLHEAKTFMVPDLKVFISKYNDFLIPVYEEIENQSQEMRNILIDILNNDDKLEKEMRILAEDLVDHFDEVTLSCKKGGFRSIFQQFNSRINEFYSMMFFNRFVEKHPGIQHKAGVPMGGTFIVVYHKKPSNTVLKGPFTINGFARRLGGAAAFPGTVYVTNGNTTRTAIINPDGRFTLVVETLPVILKALTLAIPPFPFQSGELLVTTPGQVANIQVPSPPVVIENSGNNVFNSLVDGDVIADFYLPYICSSNCTPIQFVIHESINHVPVANAGPDQVFTLPQNATILDGSSSSDPENKPLTYSWVLVSEQQGVVFSDPGSVLPAVSNLNEPGEYIFELTVEDEQGKSHTDQVIVTVNPEPNLIPTANAGNDQAIVLPASTASLVGTGTDPENKPLSFSWVLLNGPTTVNFSNASEAQTQVSNLSAPGQYVFRLTVTDEKLATDTDEVIITVRAPQNNAPIANAGGPLTVTLPTTFVQLDGTGSSDPEGRPLTFLWDTTNADLRITRKTSPRAIAYDLTRSLTYTIRLIVQDDILQSDTDNLDIRIEGERRKENCMELKNIGAVFANFIEDDSEPANLFREAFPAIKEVQEYFNTLVQLDIPGKSVSEQIVFFHDFELEVNREGAATKVLIVEALIGWLDLLFQIIQKDDPEKIRIYAMRLYNVLVFFATYIACIQRGPQERTVDILELVQFVEKQLILFEKDAVRKFEDEHLMQLMRLRAIVDDEIFVIETTGQIDSKKTYHEVLQRIRAMLDELLDF